MGSARCITSLQHKAIFVLLTHAMLWTIASSSLRVTWFSLTPSDGKKYLISLQNHITIVKVYCKKDHQCVKSRSSATDKSLSSENVRNSKNDMIYENSPGWRLKTARNALCSSRMSYRGVRNIKDTMSNKECKISAHWHGLSPHQALWWKIRSAYDIIFMHTFSMSIPNFWAPFKNDCINISAWHGFCNACRFSLELGMRLFLFVGRNKVD